ncbi:hypothetical protein B0H11DRAFT_619814 [Mycena galericulata]|nr:hypothetical protein B0H11DRAFT_619814 [Mycena galericulata]
MSLAKDLGISGINAPSMAQHIQFYINAVVAPSSVPSESKALREYVRVRVADRKDHRKTVMNLPHLNPAVWNEHLAPLVLDDASQITFELRHRPQWWPSGSLQLAVTESYSLHDLLEMQWPGSHITLPLCATHTESGPGVTVKIGGLRISIRAVSSLKAAEFFVDSLKHTVREFQRKSKTLSAKHAARYRAGYEALKPICGILNVVGPLLAFSPEPICAAVVGIVRAAAKLVKKQIEQDADVMAFIKKLQVIYGTIVKATALHKLHPDTRFENALLELVSVLSDFTQFMLKFSRVSFLGRVARTPERASDLENLQARLTRSKRNLDRALLIMTVLAHEKVERQTEKLRALKLIETLNHIETCTAGLPRCKDGEHAATLAHIKSWATSAFQDGVDKNIFWLRGPAGCGKSKVVATFFDDFLDAHQIGGNLFFDEYRKKDPALAMQTLATQLGMQFQHSFQALTHAIGNGITANPLIVNCSLEEQFDTLVLQPLLAHAPKTPLVFLVDGIEWCGHGMDADSARKQQGLLMEVLRVLLEGSAHFPPNVRLLISSREDERVRDLLGDCRRVAELEMEAAVKSEPLSWLERWNRR